MKDGINQVYLFRKEKKLKAIVIFKDNWADEMDISGFTLYNSLIEAEDAIKKGWKELETEYYEKVYDYTDKEYFEKHGDWKYEEKKIHCYCVGSNEDIEYTSFDYFKRCFEIVEITDKEYNSIKKLFGKYFGFCPSA